MRTSRNEKSATALEIEAFPKWQGHIVDPAYIPKQYREQRDRYLEQLSSWILGHGRGTWCPGFLADAVKRERRRLELETFPRLEELSPNPLELAATTPGYAEYVKAIGEWCRTHRRREAFWPTWLPEFIQVMRKRQEAA